jgi:hypothetical protein
MSAWRTVGSAQWTGSRRSSSVSDGGRPPTTELSPLSSVLCPLPTAHCPLPTET